MIYRMDMCSHVAGYHGNGRQVCVGGETFASEAAEDVCDADRLWETGHTHWGRGHHLTKHEVWSCQATDHFPKQEKSQ